MQVNIYKDKLLGARLFGASVLYSAKPIPREDVPQGWYCYDLRGTVRHPDEPYALVDQTEDCHAGSVLSYLPLKSGRSQKRLVKDMFQMLGTNPTLAEFCAGEKIRCPETPLRHTLCPASPEDAGLFYALEPEEDKELGTIGLDCEDKRLGVTKDDIAAVDLVIRWAGCEWLSKDRLTMDSFKDDPVVADAVDRLQQTLKVEPLVGRISFASGEKENFTDPQKYLQAIQEELPYRATTGFHYETLTDDPAIREAVDGFVCDLYVVVENQDFGQLIRHYDRKESLFYCAPPYHATEGYYQNIGEDGFTEKDHIRLRDTLMSIEGKFLLSYNDDPFVRELYNNPGIQIEPITRLNNIKQRYDPNCQFEEVFIANYDMTERGLYLPEQINLFG